MGIDKFHKVSRRQTLEETGTEERPLPPSISKVLGKLKAAGTAESVIVQLEESERKLQSLRSEYPRSSRVRHMARPKCSRNGSRGHCFGRSQAPATAGPREGDSKQLTFQQTISKPKSEHCPMRCGRDAIAVDLECQSGDESESPCTSIADSALTKSMRLLEELKLFDQSEDALEAEPGNEEVRTRAESFASEPNTGESVAFIKERIDLLIDLLQQPNEKLSSQRDAVIDELRSAIHEHTRQRKATMDELESCAARLQSCVSSPTSALTRTPSDTSAADFFARCCDHSPGCSTALECPRSSGLSTTLPVLEGDVLYEDKLHSIPSHVVPPPACSSGILPRRASCPPPVLKAISRTLNSKTLAQSPRHFSPRRLVCTSVKVTRTWRYE